MSIKIRIESFLHSNWGFFVFFIISFFLFSLRNLDPINYPTLYAEDGVWTADLINNGFYNTAFNARLFPILGFVIFYKVGLLIVDLVLDGNHLYLPLVYFVLSNLFLSLMVAFTFRVVSKCLSLSAGLFVVMFMILLPVGGDGNEIFGRVLNLGFIFPVLQVVLLTVLCRNNISKASVLAIAIFSGVSGLTFPVGLGLSVIFIFYLSYLWLNNKGNTTYILSILLLIIPLVFFFLSINAETFSNKGGADLPFKWQSFVEFSVARSILYPLVFYFYGHLNDLIVLVITVLITMLIIRRFRRNGNNDDTRLGLVLWSGFLLYFGVTVAMRSGLTHFFDNYSSTFPDRYFTGLNLLFILCLAFTIDGCNKKNHIYFLLLLPVMLTASKRFEMTEPKIKMDSVMPFTLAMCLSKQDNNSKFVKIDIPPKGWSMLVPEALLADTISNSCKQMPFYDFYPLTRLQSHVIYYPKPMPSTSTSKIKNIEINNAIELTKKYNVITVEVTGSDPSLVFSLDQDRTNGEHSFISFSLISHIDGELQVYYRTNDDQYLSESKSLFISIKKGMNNINLSFSDAVIKNDIRLDFPDKMDEKYSIVM